MVAGCGPTCAKWTLFVFNLIFWLTGAAILGVGIWVKVDPTMLHYLHIATISTSDKLVPAAGIVLICVGLFIFITGFFGCCGAVKEHGCMLMTYAAILVFILILQVVAGILAAVFRNKINETLQNSMNMTVTKRYGAPNHNSTTVAYDTLQVNLKCCGAVHGPADWIGSNWKQDPKHANMNVPLTCCVLTKPDPRNPKPLNEKRCQEDAKNYTAKTSDYVHKDGCYPEFQAWLRRNIGILIGVAFGLVFIQIFVIVLACVVRRAKASEYQYV